MGLKSLGAKENFTGGGGGWHSTVKITIAPGPDLGWILTIMKEVTLTRAFQIVRRY